MNNRLKVIKTSTLTFAMCLSLFFLAKPTYATVIISQAEIALNFSKSLVPVFILLIVIAGLISLIIYLTEKNHKQELKKEIKPFLFMNIAIIISTIILNIFLSVIIHNLTINISPGLLEKDKSTNKAELVSNLFEFSIPALSLILPITFTAIFQYKNIKSKTKYIYWAIYGLTVIALILSLIAIILLTGQPFIQSTYSN